MVRRCCATLTTLLVIQWKIVNIPEPQNFHVIYLYDWGFIKMVLYLQGKGKHLEQLLLVIACEQTLGRASWVWSNSFAPNSKFLVSLRAKVCNSRNSGLCTVTKNVWSCKDPKHALILTCKFKDLGAIWWQWSGTEPEWALCTLHNILFKKVWNRELFVPQSWWFFPLPRSCCCYGSKDHCWNLHPSQIEYLHQYLLHLKMIHKLTRRKQKKN